MRLSCKRNVSYGELRQTLLPSLPHQFVDRPRASWKTNLLLQLGLIEPPLSLFTQSVGIGGRPVSAMQSRSHSSSFSSSMYCISSSLALLTISGFTGNLSFMDVKSRSHVQSARSTRVSRGTCEMRRGGLQDSPSPSTSRRAQKKTRKEPWSKHASRGSRSLSLCNPIHWQAWIASVSHRRWRFNHQFPCAHLDLQGKVRAKCSRIRFRSRFPSMTLFDKQVSTFPPNRKRATSFLSTRAPFDVLVAVSHGTIRRELPRLQVNVLDGI